MGCLNLCLLHAIPIGVFLLIILKSLLDRLFCRTPAVPVPHIGIFAHGKYAHQSLAPQKFHIFLHLILGKGCKLRKFRLRNQRVPAPLYVQFNDVCRRTGLFSFKFLYDLLPEPPFDPWIRL